MKVRMRRRYHDVSLNKPRIVAVRRDCQSEGQCPRKNEDDLTNLKSPSDIFSVTFVLVTVLFPKALLRTSEGSHSCLYLLNRKFFRVYL